MGLPLKTGSWAHRMCSCQLPLNHELLINSTVGNKGTVKMLVVLINCPCLPGTELFPGTLGYQGWKLGSPWPPRTHSRGLLPQPFPCPLPISYSLIPLEWNCVLILASWASVKLADEMEGLCSGVPPAPLAEVSAEWYSLFGWQFGQMRQRPFKYLFLLTQCSAKIKDITKYRS